MKVGELKELLQGWLDNLDYYDDDQEVKMEGNTYWVHGQHFIGISGYNGGYLDMDNLDEKIMDDEEE